MTLVGYILMTVVFYQSSVFDDPIMGTTQLMLPSEAACKAAAENIKQQNITDRVYCIPVYDNPQTKETK